MSGSASQQFPLREIDGNNIFLSVLTLHTHQIPLPTGRTDNLSMREPDGKIIGFMHVNTLAPAPATELSGIVPVYGPNVGIFLFVKQDGPDPITFLDESAFSDAPSRFAFGSDQVIAPGVVLILVYDSHLQRWLPFGA